MTSEAQFFFGLERAIDARPAPGKIQSRHLKGFNTAVRNRGFEPLQMLERHGIDPVAFADPNRHLDCKPAAEMLEYCSVLFRDELFGFHLAEYQDPDVFGCVTTLAQSAPTFRTALQALIDYIPLLHSPEGQVGYVTTANTLEIRWGASGDLCSIQQPNCHGFLLMMKTLQALGGEYFRPRYINFTFDLSRRALAHLHSRYGCKILLADRNAVALPLDILERPIATANRLLFDLLNGYFASVTQACKAPAHDQIETYICGSLPSGTCSMSGCAAALGISSRALQKRLERRGTSFSAVVQDQRIAIAKRALMFSNATLDEVAFSIGYSDQTCFGRAFKQWTGLTPNAFRAQARHEPASVRTSSLSHPL